MTSDSGRIHYIDDVRMNAFTPNTSSLAHTDNTSVNDSRARNVSAGVENVTHIARMTQEEYSALVNHVSGEYVDLLTPSVVFLSTVAVVGVPGNSLVLLVYLTKLKLTSTKFLIIVMAVFDLLINLVVIPLQLFEIYHQFRYPADPWCGVVKYLTTFVTGVGAYLLLVVAVVRYRKICASFGTQVGVRHAKLITLALIVFSLLGSVPEAILYGQTTTFGRQCDVTQEYKDTSLPSVMFAVRLTVAASLAVALVCLYILIGVKAFHHSTVHGISSTEMSSAAKTKNSLSSSRPETEVESGQNVNVGKDNDSSGSCDHVKDYGDNASKGNETESRSKESESSPNQFCCRCLSDVIASIYSKRRSSTTSTTKRRGMGRTTVTLCVITAVFVLTYIPQLCVLVLFHAGSLDMETLGAAEISVLYFVVHLTFINSATNPIFYSIWDRNFRQKCKQLFTFRNHV